MRVPTLWNALAALLLAALATAADSPSSSEVVVTVATPRAVDPVTRFLETVHHFKPSVFYEFIHHLTEYKTRPKLTFQNPIFSPAPAGLDGRKAPSPYKDHNPIFTRHCNANDTNSALELSLWRSMLFRETGMWPSLRLAVAANLVRDKVEEMHVFHDQREAEVEKPENTVTNCITWMDIGGTKVCDLQQFWKTIGNVQALHGDIIEIPGTQPKVEPFDRLLPPVRNESLPLVVLYAAPRDEAFPKIYERLHMLATGEAPRLQLALRWRSDPKDDTEGFVASFRAEATIKEGLSVPEVQDARVFSNRAISFVRGAKDKYAAFTQVATQLPAVAEQILKTSVRRSLPQTTTLTERLLLNGRPIALEDLTHQGLLDLFSQELRYFELAQTATHGFWPDVAKQVIFRTNMTLETPRKTATSLAVPTVDRPLRFISPHEAFKGAHYNFTRNSFIEGATPETATTEEEGDPPALATFWVVADLDSAAGRKLVKNALRFADQTTQVRFSFVHNPSKSSPAPHKFSLSRIIPELVINNMSIAEVFPSELIAFLEHEATPSNPPKRALDDAWTSESPLTPYVTEGATNETLAQEYWSYTTPFAQNIGLQPGEAAVVLNGRVIELRGAEFAPGSFSALHQYEMKRRIKPVVEAADPVLPETIKENRKAKADLYAWTTGIVAAKIGERRWPTPEQVKGLAFFAHGNTTNSLFDFVAVVNPLSPFAREVAPLLQSFKTNAYVSSRVYLIPSADPKLELTKLFAKSFPLEIGINEDQSENPPSAVFRGLPEGTILDVKAFPLEGEEIPGPGGLGGESVRAPGEARFGVVPVATPVDDEHVRDEL
ncbi:hypothetical protein JCM10908_005365 [Rhodotorula pacifica]|uniref:uncharacterized protein n=1 Tax=Rhodotorula pacifica TaxID=1495444 RepID=UPI00316DACEF